MNQVFVRSLFMIKNQTFWGNVFILDESLPKKLMQFGVKVR